MSYSFPTIFDTNTLIQVVPNLKTAQTFILDTFFPVVTNSDSEFVSIDIDVGKRRLAPFVSPLVEGKIVEQRRIQTNTFKPPYIKDKRAPDLRRPVRRMIGERIGGDMNPVERMMQNLQFEMEDQLDMIQRRMEWMACQSLINGTLTMKGDGFPSVTIDFGRASALTITLTGTAMWDSGNAAATPALNIDAWQNLVLKNSGAVVTDIVFTPTPFYYFTQDKTVLNAIVTDTSKFAYPNKNQVQMAAEAKHGAILKGVWGNFRLWVYNDWYVDTGNEGGTVNTEYRMIPDGTILLLTPQLMGIRAFATILDPDFSYAAMSYAPKVWTQPDPAQRLLMMQSSPLTIPARVNACLSAVVTNSIQS
jgi:hypothetical protein